MNQHIRVKDKVFECSIPEAQIQKQVKRIADEINTDYDGQEPVFLVVLNGAFMFAADLLRNITLSCEVCFIKLSSYSGTTSMGEIREIMGMDKDVSGRPVIIIEDIVDTGLTMTHLTEMLKEQQPASIDICTLLLKPDNLNTQLDIRYCCLSIPSDFIVGYGLDYDGWGRNSRDIYTVVKE